MAALPVVLMMAALLVGCGTEDTPKAERLPVAYVTAEPTAFTRAIALTGSIVARDTATYSFETGGRVTEVHVDVGSHVEPGTVLATLDPTQQQADVDAAKAKVGSNAAQLAKASAAFERQKTLLAQGFTTRSDYDSAEQTLASAQSALDSSKADLSTAETNLKNTTLTADAKGVITSRSIDPGQVVNAAQAAFGFAKSGALDAVFQIQEQLLLSGRKPKAIKVSMVSDPSVQAVGHIREVSPLINSDTGTVQVKVGLDNPPDKMTLGSPVVGHDASEAAERAIALPWKSLMVKAGKPAVWVINAQDEAVLTPIKIAAYQTDEIYVAEGLKPGDRVITAGSQLVLPGEKLQLVAAKENAQ
ncbi:efflux RND transporter periplasmic adaptor subunit [Jiella sp. MQZ9-1]|uniref:Efflux RND transporter periplasmic adaptor subunit n=1 Tax=Jiella flava TaxID=2816857 RepID=A0A939JU59_9HYPH|nr:efflux RND transporter periplasmic adaptor subunit [Jiella flava]MBO0661084.1 efflux RND transporter periplasmic adaptor subunit [Jiella flava]MCD2469731.1 efflux RND transporter periplasmic adaptor subunit [Jiella flava]